jgi:hypothetical protein
VIVNQDQETAHPDALHAQVKIAVPVEYNIHNKKTGGVYHDK